MINMNKIIKENRKIVDGVKEDSKNKRIRIDNGVSRGLVIATFMLIVAVLIVVEGHLVEGATSYSGLGSSGITQYNYQPGFQTYYSSNDIKNYWPIVDSQEACEARQDLVLQVAPGGCTPGVVRSDLLAEQNVPVFCQIDALKLNPLISIEEIKNIRFRGNYPKEVAGAGFHPAKAALRTNDILLGSPLINNIGYVAVFLKRNPVEKELPDFVNLTLQAHVDYDSGNALGIGRAEFYLTEQSEQDWNNEKNRQSFWWGRYFVRLEEADANVAIVGIYQGDRKITTSRIERGKLSEPIYLPGTYCRAGLQASYDGFEAAQKKARLEISDGKGADVLDVYEGSSIINGKCTVRTISVNTLDNTGIVRIKCPSTPEFSLSLAAKSSLVTSEVSKIIDEQKSAGLIIGLLKTSDTEVNKNIETCEVELSGSEVPFDISQGPGFYSIRRAAQTSNAWNLYYREKISGINIGGIALGSGTLYSDEVIKNDRTGFLRNLTNELTIKCERKKVLLEKKYDEETERYFNETIMAFEKVVDEYPREKENQIIGTESLGEKALIGSINLAKDYKKQETQVRLMQKFVEIYPDSIFVSQYKQDIDDLFKVDHSGAGESILVDGRYRTIRLVSLSSPKIEKASATFELDGRRVNVASEEEHFFTGGDNSQAYFKLQQLRDAENVRIIYRCSAVSSDGIRPLTREELNKEYFNVLGSLLTSEFGRFVGTIVHLDRPINICGKSLVLREVNVGKYAKIRLTPKVQGTDTETNVSVKIGIEKRAIQLSPEKTKEKIDNLNKSIEKWDGISKNLGKAVSGLKGACFATAGVLTIKSFLGGIDGSALAREHTMSGDYGWNKKCKNFISNGKYKTMTECFNDKANEINKEVNQRKEALNNVNKELQAIESQPGISTGSALLSGKSVDTIKAEKDYLVKLQGMCDRNELDAETCAIIKGLPLPDDKGNAPYRYADLRELHYQGLLKKQELGVAEQSLKDLNNRLESNKRIYEEKEKASAVAREKYKMTLGEAGMTKARPLRASITDFSGSPGNYKLNGEPIIVPSDLALPSNVSSAALFTGVKEVNVNGIKKPEAKQLIALGTKVGNTLDPRGIYEFEKKEDGTIELKNPKVNSVENTRNIVQLRAEYQFKEIEDPGEKLYINRIGNEDLKVRYFETGPDKGFAAIVPFDTINGWYAKVDSSLGIGNQIAAYDASGVPKSWKICNVGVNDRIDEIGDDCQGVLERISTDQRILGLSSEKSRELIGKSRAALFDANRKKGNKFININGVDLSVGEPATQFANVECQNFMSPEDCKKLFNVCDPVICPATRCNLGGEYPVSNVIQTGIIGSTLLCLPNIREGIIIPVCLSGIQAGVDNYVSILKANRDCLQENLKSGRTVGICDVITSVYTCEFFWRQIAPLAKVVIPKLVEFAYGGGQGARGGGEYLTIMGAWNNMQNSINYFKDSYAVNSLNAFRLRSIDEAGGEFCKAFISSKAPGTFETLLEPDSPPQFTASFSSEKYSDVTVPATAQYKVFYHLYAGRDSGIYFRVYLKNPPSSAYYSSAPIIQIASGFLGRGQYADETRDFTAPEGYKELCVDINGEEKCGFGQVSTSFAVNYLRDQFAKDELTRKDITTERECVSGSPSLLGVAAELPNPQAAVEQGLFPQDYQRGIVRICASQNPGGSTEPSRYADNGYCGDQKLRCWLDLKSVDKAISDSNVGLKNKTLNELEKTQRETLERTGIILTEGDAAAKLKELEKDKNRLDGAESLQEIISGGTGLEGASSLFKKADAIFEKLFYNHHKARLLVIKAQIYEKVARGYLQLARDQGSGVSASAQGTASQQPPRVTTTTVQDVYTIKLSDNSGLYLSYSPILQEWQWSLDKQNWKVVSDTSSLSSVGTRDSEIASILQELSAPLVDEEQGKQILSNRIVETSKVSVTITSPQPATGTQPSQTPAIASETLYLLIPTIDKSNYYFYDLKNKRLVGIYVDRNGGAIYRLDTLNPDDKIGTLTGDVFQGSVKIDYASSQRDASGKFVSVLPKEYAALDGATIENENIYLKGQTASFLETGVGYLFRIVEGNVVDSATIHIYEEKNSKTLDIFLDGSQIKYDNAGPANAIIGNIQGNINSGTLQLNEIEATKFIGRSLYLFFNDAKISKLAIYPSGTGKEALTPDFRIDETDTIYGKRIFDVINERYINFGKENAGLYIKSLEIVYAQTISVSAEQGTTEIKESIGRIERGRIIIYAEQYKILGDDLYKRLRNAYVEYPYIYSAVKYESAK